MRSICTRLQPFLCIQCLVDLELAATKPVMQPQLPSKKVQSQCISCSILVLVMPALSLFHVCMHANNFGPWMSRNHIIQYHEVIGGLVGPWGERAALFFNVVSLLGLAVVQIIACASDAYYLYDGLNKR